MGPDDKIRQSVAPLTFEPLNPLISHYVTVKGTQQRCNMFVLVGYNDDSLVVGKLIKAVQFIRIQKYTLSLRYIRLFVSLR